MEQVFSAAFAVRQSGPVRDLTIRGNEFVEPGGSAILIDPLVARRDGVHPGQVRSRIRRTAAQREQVGALWLEHLTDGLSDSVHIRVHLSAITRVTNGPVTGDTAT